MRISDWSSDVCSSDLDEGRQSKADLDRLMTRLETNLETFQTRSKAAHQMTRDYGSELEDHLTDLEQLQKTGQIVSSLADLAKTMLERTRKAEDEMRRSEDEAKSLRRSLRSEEHTSELQSLMRISYAVFCLKKKQK